MNMISGCMVSGKMEFIDPPCDCMAKATIGFEALVYGDCCECSGCEPACECPSGTTVNGVSGAVNLTSPDGSVTIDENGQDIELVVSGLQPLVPNYSTTPRYTGRKWFDDQPSIPGGHPIQEVVVSGFAPAPGQSVQIKIPCVNQYLNIIKSNVVIFAPDGYGATLPIPYHQGSGMTNSYFKGTWTVSYHDDGNLDHVMEIEASANADDLSSMVVFGILEFFNI